MLLTSLHKPAIHMHPVAGNVLRSAISPVILFRKHSECNTCQYRGKPCAVRHEILLVRPPPHQACIFLVAQSSEGCPVNKQSAWLLKKMSIRLPRLRTCIFSTTDILCMHHCGIVEFAIRCSPNDFQNQRNPHRSESPATR